MSDTDMCPNCITPWKCNGPYLDGYDNHGRSAGAAPLDPERHREAMTLLRMANPRMAIGGASADAWLGEVSAFLREAGTDE